MEVIHEAPTHDSFVPLSTHQSRTPESFFSGPPILYHHTAAAILKTQVSELNCAPALQSLLGRGQPPTDRSAAVNGHSQGEQEDRQVEVIGIDIWVSSECASLLIAERMKLTMTYNAGDLSFFPPPSELVSRFPIHPSLFTPFNAQLHLLCSSNFLRSLRRLTIMILMLPYP